MASTPMAQSSDLSKLKIQNKDSSALAAPWLRALLAVTALLLVVVALYIMRAGDNSAKVKDHNLASSRSSHTPLPAASNAQILNATGYVVAQRAAAVSSKATGRLKELTFKEGDVVKKGQILGVLENDDLQAAVNESEAGLNVARANEVAARAELEDARLQLGRIEELRKSSFASQSNLDTARTRARKSASLLDAAQAQIKLSAAQLKRVQTELEYTFIRAPFDGTVLKKDSEVGEIVAPFGSSTNARAAIATIADMKSLQIEADVSEANLSKVYAGQECAIVLDSLPERTYSGVVDEIVPTVDRAKATVLTKIRFMDIDDKVIPEMSAKVTFILKELS